MPSGLKNVVSAACIAPGINPPCPSKPNNICFVIGSNPVDIDDMPDTYGACPAPVYIETGGCCGITAGAGACATGVVAVGACATGVGLYGATLCGVAEALIGCICVCVGIAGIK